MLFTPIVYGDVEALKRLLPYTDVNIENRDCRTPLILAVEMGDIDIVKMLIKAGMSNCIIWKNLNERMFHHDFKIISQSFRNGICFKI